MASKNERKRRPATQSSRSSRGRRSSKKKSQRNGKGQRSGLFRVLKWMTVLGFVGGILATAALVGTYLYFAQGLPDIRTVADYQPPQVTKILASDKTVIGQFFSERRTLVERKDIPDVLVQAILSAEDADFYSHEGLDYMGMLRALYNSLRAGRVTGSGSTITQQTVKNLLLTPERSYRRKARELILARRLDSSLSKDDILTIYLNAIYLGHGRYGVEEASRYYFGHSVRKMNINESAILAGLIQSPERISPRKHPKKAKARRRYVLKQMVKNGHIKQAVADAVDQQPLALAPVPQGYDASYRWFVDEVRRRLVAQFGEDVVMTGGLTVHTSLDPARQKAAVLAVQAGLRALDKRQGFGKPLKRAFGPKSIEWRKKRRKKLKNKAPSLGRVVPARVQKITSKHYLLDLGVGTARLPRRIDARIKTNKRKRFEIGDVIRVKLRTDGPRHPKRMWATLADIPQGAFVAISTTDRRVLALVGGWDHRDYPFNRVTDARRQPGSAFKPFVWGAAMESRRLTPASTLVDAPETLRVYQGQFWQPRNYTGKFRGLISLRTALAHSVNSVAVNIAETIGVPVVEDFARRAGLKSKLAQGLAIALGSSEVRPIELVNAYISLGTGRQVGEPQFITRVEKRKGSQRPDVAHATGTITPEVAYLVRSMMRSVVTDGSGRSLKSIERPIVGKTGTTNAARDAWFVGLLPDVAFGAWVGFDENRSLGRKESGGRTAAPIINAYVRAAEMDGPQWPEAPDGIEMRKIAPDGRLAPDGLKTAREEFFLVGTEPREYAAAEGQLDAQSFFFEDDQDTKAKTAQALKAGPKDSKSQASLLAPVAPIKAKRAASRTQGVQLTPVAPIKVKRAETKKPKIETAGLDLSPITPVKAVQKKTAQPRTVKPSSRPQTIGKPTTKAPTTDEDRPNQIAPMQDEDKP